MVDHYNPFSQEDTPTDMQDNNKSSNNNRAGMSGGLKYVLVVVGALIILSVSVFAYLSFSGGSKKDTSRGYSRNLVSAQLKVDTVIFLNHYLNMNYTMFKDERRRAEKFMTPNLLTQYKNVFYQTAFVQEILEKKLTTSYIYNEVIATVYENKTTNNRYPAVRVIGNLKYNSVKKNIPIEMPITITCVWQKSKDGIWKIDNLLME
jgi:uncharacterized SAM-binding protein YcdF (DUF218 family)